MSWFRISTLFLLLLSASVTVTPAQAELLVAQSNPQSGEFKVRGERVGKLIEELKLSPDQVKRLQQIRQDSQTKIKSRRLALKTARQELKTLMNSNSATVDQIRQKRKQVQSLQQEVADIGFENTLAIRDVLTPEQRVKLQQLMQQRRQQNQRNFKGKNAL
jgi:Spy/CpxP family protein refolding chaperone